ncbi:hypothetical protein E6H36_10755 [Candidatus Bathyarchaeota archaeon]|nr:MAG: hypothetical protein E6H36_10755 [Candidatus Bathyarchaeota archaeon]
MSSEVLELLKLSLAVFVVSFTGTALVRRLAHRFGWMAKPREDRWHKQPIALHGGVGFFLAFILGAVWVVARNGGIEWLESLSSASLPEEVVLIGALLVGSFLMFFFGLWDDLKQCRPAPKLVFQVIAASLFISAGGVFPLTGTHVLDVLVTYFWFVGITNAVNMLDNMDGLASGVVILAGGTLVVLAMGASPSRGTAPLAFALGQVFIAALLGFWVYNRPPASIFMGDSGSLFIGYALAAMSVPSPLNGFMGINRGETVLGPLLALLIPAIVLSVPIFDTTLVTITRKWRAQKATQGGRDHSSHRLVGLGLSEKRTVWVLYSFAAFGGVMAVLMQRFPHESLPLLGFFVLILILSGVYLGHMKVQTVEPHQLPPVWTPFVSQILYKRHAAEVLLDTILIVICFYAAYLLRFDGVISQPTEKVIVVGLPIVVASCLVTYFLTGIYRGQWRLISIADLSCYVVGVCGGAALSLAVVTLVTRFDAGHSRSAYIIFGLLVFIAMVGSRLSFRLLDALLRNGSHSKNGNHKRVLIYGAGKAGKLLHEEITSNPAMSDYVVEGFVDDDPHRVGRKLCGVTVMSTGAWLRHPWHCTPEIWISSRFITDEQAQQFACKWDDNVTVRRLHLQMKQVNGYSHDLLGFVPAGPESDQRIISRDGQNLSEAPQVPGHPFPR